MSRPANKSQGEFEKIWKNPEIQELSQKRNQNKPLRT